MTIEVKKWSKAIYHFIDIEELSLNILPTTFSDYYSLRKSSLKRSTLGFRFGHFIYDLIDLNELSLKMFPSSCQHFSNVR